MIFYIKNNMSSPAFPKAVLIFFPETAIKPTFYNIYFRNIVLIYSLNQFYLPCRTMCFCSLLKKKKLGESFKNSIVRYMATKETETSTSYFYHVCLTQEIEFDVLHAQQESNSQQKFVFSTNQIVRNICFYFREDSKSTKMCRSVSFQFPRPFPVCICYLPLLLLFHKNSHSVCVCVQIFICLLQKSLMMTFLWLQDVEAEGIIFSSWSLCVR